MAQLPKSRSVTPFSETKDYPLETIVAGIEWKNKNKVKIMGCVYETELLSLRYFYPKEDKVFIESIST